MSVFSTNCKHRHLRSPVRVLTTNKTQVVLLWGFVVLAFITCFIVLRANQNLARYYWPQRGFPKQQLALAPIPICSRQEPYDLSLCLRTTKEATTPGIAERQCRPEHEIFDSPGNRCISYNMLQRMPDKMLAMARRPAIYSIYPQDIPLPVIMQTVRNNRPIPMTPINNPKLVLIRTSQYVCPMSQAQPHVQYELIIIVKSAPANGARRDRLRRLISKQTAKFAGSVGLLFSLGVPADIGNRSKLLEAISYEATTFEDIILTDFTDTYYNLTLKTLLNLRFAHVACRGASPLLAFMDDDHGLNLPALHYYFHIFASEERHRGRLRHSIFGHIQRRAPVGREPGNKEAVTRSDMPFDIYPDFASSPCYFIGAEAVASLSIAAAFTKSFPLEDVFVGLTAAKLGIEMHDLPDVYHHGPPQNAKLRWAPLVASLEYFEKYTS